MKIWRFRDPTDSRYAQAGRRGSWSQSKESACAECGASRQQRIPPLIMEWEPSSEAVGDFTWPGFGFEVVVTDSAAVVLGRFSGFELSPVEITGSDSGQANVPREWPPLHELWVTKWVSLDQQRSTARRVSTCGSCGSEVWEVDGAERVDSEWDAAAGQLVREHEPRVPGAGIIVTEANLGIFRVREFPGWSFCTDDVVHAVEEEKLTNAGFLEVGDQVPRTQ